MLLAQKSLCLDRLFDIFDAVLALRILDLFRRRIITRGLQVTGRCVNYRGDIVLAQALDNDIELRPMLVLDPPILPMYLRAIFAVTELLEDPTVAYGGALGVGGSLFGLGIFAETGVLPRSKNDKFFWVIEGRIGVYYSF